MKGMNKLRMILFSAKRLTMAIVAAYRIAKIKKIANMYAYV